MDTFGLSPTLDAFASHQTAHLPRYMALHADKRSVGRDAMLQPWDAVTYLFPPTPLLSRVIQRIKAQSIRAILICPRWPSALWWALVLELLVEPPLPLPHYLEALHPVVDGNQVPYLDPLVALHVFAGETA